MSMKRKSHRPGSKKPPASGRAPSSKMTPREVAGLVDELLSYHHQMASAFQRGEQRQWSLFYLCGQLSPIERKAIDPMVLELTGADPNAVRALDQFVGAGGWDAQLRLQRHQELVAESLGDPDGVVIVDGSGCPKQGQHSAGVARQYGGSLGKVANCQEGVFAVYASQQGDTFWDGRLSVHESWFEAAAHERWRACGIPEDLVFRTEPELALELLHGLVTRGVLPFRWVAADEHFGQNPAFLDEISALGKWYFVEVPCDTRVWLRTPAIEPPGPGLMGRPRTKARVVLKAPRPLEVRQLAMRLPRQAWTRYFIKEGRQGLMVAEFAVLRVTQVRDQLPGPRGLRTDPELKFYFSHAPTTIAPRELAQLSGWRWPIETTLEEGKGLVGMDHYETRSWCGWYHQMGQSFMAHYFLRRLRRQFKKKSSDDYGTSPCADRLRTSGRRRTLGPHAGHRRISAEAKSFGILFTPQQHAETLSSQNFDSSKARSLQVI